MILWTSTSQKNKNTKEDSHDCKKNSTPKIANNIKTDSTFIVMTVTMSRR